MAGGQEARRVLDVLQGVLDDSDADLPVRLRGTLERPRFEAAVARAADAVTCALAEGVEAAMNRFNGTPA